MKPVVRCVNGDPCLLQDSVDRLLIVCVETATLKTCGAHENWDINACLVLRSPQWNV